LLNSPQIVEQRSPLTAARGFVFDLMRYSLHNGPGVRTTLFLKGCPLRCLWCHNPESQGARAELKLSSERCIGCGDCVRRCPHGALSSSAWEGRDVEACTLCGACVEACPAEAREMIGRWISVDEALKAVLRDELLYEESGGGVTFSGGEPLMQPQFLRAMLAACQSMRLHCVVDTCGEASTDVVESVRPLVDLFLYDLKAVDCELHTRLTGQGNERILANLEHLARAGANLILRMPVLPGLNDGNGELAARVALMKRLHLRRIDLLPYHKLGADKHHRLRRAYKLEELPEPSADAIAEMAQRLRKEGLTVGIGG